MALIENVLSGDLILNINLLSRDQSYRKKIEKIFFSNGIVGIDFEDAKVTEYRLYPLQPRVMEEIEKEVQEIVLQSFSDVETKKFFEKISSDDREYLSFSHEDFFRRGGSKLPFLNSSEKVIDKFKQIIEVILDKNLSLMEQLEEQARQIESKEVMIQGQARQIEELKLELDTIKSSKVWRLGDFFRRLFYIKLLGKFPSLQRAAITLSNAGFRIFYVKVKDKLRWNFKRILEFSGEPQLGSGTLKNTNFEIYLQPRKCNMKADREEIQKKLKSITEEIAQELRK